MQGMGTALFCVLTLRVVVIYNGRFGTTYQSHPQRVNPEHGTDRSSQKLVRNYPYLLRNNPEECSSQLLRGRSLKSHTQDIFTRLRPHANQTVQNL